jgi:hypothetical protein
MSAAGKRHMGRVAESGCLIGNRALGQCEGRNEVHHVAEGSGQRSDFGTVCLCSEHHRGSSGLHGMGVKAFVRLYRVPGEIEYGLLVWQAEDLAKVAA